MNNRRLFASGVLCAKDIPGDSSPQVSSHSSRMAGRIFWPKRLWYQQYLSRGETDLAGEMLRDLLCRYGISLRLCDMRRVESSFL